MFKIIGVAILFFTVVGILVPVVFGGIVLGNDGTIATLIFLGVGGVLTIWG